jgi:hypothetical protein
MSELLVDVVIAVVAIAGAAAWLYFPKREPQVRDGQWSRHHRPGSLALSRHKTNPARYHVRRMWAVGQPSEVNDLVSEK